MLRLGTLARLLRPLLVSRAALKVSISVAIAMSIPAAALLIAAAQDVESTENAELLYQRDVAGASRKSTIFRRAKTTATAETSITVIEIIGPPGAELLWPGINVVPDPGTALGSDALRNSPSDLITVGWEQDRSPIGFLSDELLVDAEEKVLLVFLGPDQDSGDTGFVPISPGFDQSPNSELTESTTKLFIVAALVVLLPVAALARAAAQFFVRFNERRLATARLFGLTGAVIRFALAGAVTVSTGLGIFLSILFSLSVENTSAYLGYARPALMPPAQLAIGIGFVLVGYALIVTFVLSRSVSVEPLAVKRRSGVSETSTLLTAALLSLSFASALFKKEQFGESLPEAVSLIMLLVMLGGGAWGVARLVLPASRFVAQRLARFSSSLTYAAGVFREYQRDFKGVIFPIAFAAFMSGIALAVSASLHPTPPSADLSVLFSQATLSGPEAIEAALETDGVKEASLEYGRLNINLRSPAEAERVLREIGESVPILLVEYPVELANSEAIQFGRIRDIIAFATSSALVLMALAAVVTLMAIFEDQRPQVTLMRVMGLTHIGSAVVGAISVAAPIVASISVPLAFGVWLGTLLRDEELSEGLIATPSNLTLSILSGSALLVLCAIPFRYMTIQPGAPPSHV